MWKWPLTEACSSQETRIGPNPRGSLMIMELGLKDDDYYGFLGPKSIITWYLDALGRVAWDFDKSCQTAAA